VTYQMGNAQVVMQRTAICVMLNLCINILDIQLELPVHMTEQHDH
ncbi:MAG: hypothetical protein RLZZ262_1026, partial [Bacteroidota bacterium]